MRDETFEVQHDVLIRRVTPEQGAAYEHRCPVSTYRELAFAAETHVGGFTLADLVTEVGCAWSRAAVALAFWKERGCVVQAGRRAHVAQDAFYEDTMIEFLALAQKTKGVQ